MDLSKYMKSTKIDEVKAKKILKQIISGKKSIYFRIQSID
jgi:hypothetical protein